MFKFGLRLLPYHQLYNSLSSTIHPVPNDIIKSFLSIYSYHYPFSVYSTFSIISKYNQYNKSSLSCKYRKSRPFYPLNLTMQYPNSSHSTSSSSSSSTSSVIPPVSSTTSSSITSIIVANQYHRIPNTTPITLSIPLPTNSTLEHPFDPSTVQEQLSIIVLEVPSIAVSIANTMLKHVLIRNIPKLRYAIPSIYDPSNRNIRWLLLNPDIITSTDITTITNEKDRLLLQAFIQILQEKYTIEKINLFSHTFTLSYETMSTEKALKKLLPPEILQFNSGHIPCSFEIAGHLAHINLREELSPWRYIIGKVILDKNPVLRTVINKLGNIENTFRTFPMEVIAGDDDTLVDMRHCNANFAFDFRQVYWNTRLHTEHDNLVQNYIPSHSIVADMFCGVGPFTVPLSMDPHNCTVYANDLNPASIAALVVNMYRNRKAIGCKMHVSNDVQKNIDSLDFQHILKDTRIKPHNMDARDFIRYIVNMKIPVQHCIMNLPADGLEFCDIFVGYYRHNPVINQELETSNTNNNYTSLLSLSNLTTTLPLPRVHVYCFSRAETDTEAADDVTQRLLKILCLPSIEKLEKLVELQRQQRQHNIEQGIWHSTTIITSSSTSNSEYNNNDINHNNNEIQSNYVIEVRKEQILSDLIIRVVRNVAPGKLMMCASFTVPYKVAIMKPIVKYNEVIDLPPNLSTVYNESKKILHKLQENQQKLDEKKKLRASSPPKTSIDYTVEPQHKRTKPDE